VWVGKAGLQLGVRRGVQREVLPRVAVDAGYFRRRYGNVRITDNTALSATDFTAYTVTVPTTQGLSRSGRALTAFDPHPVVQALNVTTRASSRAHVQDRGGRGVAAERHCGI
jgi:hypothetical protein